MQERDERAPARQPDGCLPRGVAAADHSHALAGAQLALERPGGVEDAEPLVRVETVDGQAPVFGACCEQHRAGRDLVAVLEPDHVALDARLQALGPVGRGDPGVELPRLRGCAAREFGPADPGGKAEVVLDPARGPRLAPDHGALHDQRVKALTYQC